MSVNQLPAPNPNAPLYTLDEARAAAVVADSQADPLMLMLREGLHTVGHGDPYGRLMYSGSEAVRGMGLVPRASYMIGSLLAHKLARVATVNPAPLPDLTEAGYTDLSRITNKHLGECLSRQVDFLLEVLGVPPLSRGDPNVSLDDALPAGHLLTGFKPFLEAEPGIDAAATAWRTEVFPVHTEALRAGAAMAIAGLHVAAQEIER